MGGGCKSAGVFIQQGDSFSVEKISNRQESSHPHLHWLFFVSVQEGGQFFTHLYGLRFTKVRHGGQKIISGVTNGKTTCNF
jgi:hypothetical protein